MLDTTFVQEVADLRKKIIWDGKHSDKFKKVPEKYLIAQPDKYKDLENLDNSGAINELDAMILHHLVKRFRPEYIFEIGAWFGTSAQVMLHASDNKACIWTCDKNDFFIAVSERINYMPFASWAAIERIRKLRIQIDFIFTDGQLFGNDAKKLSKLCRKRVLVTHDYEEKEKGWRNIKKMRKLWPNAKFIPPVEGSTIAVLYEES